VELARQLLVRRVVLGDDHQAGRPAIESMHDPRSLLAPDPAEIVDVMEKRIDERSARMSGGRMHHHAGRLVDDDEILVLVEDGQRERLRARRRIDRLGELDADGLAGLHELIGLRFAAGDADQPFPDQPLDLRA
jgi:hypothetical protein